jgi:hypothetical protein
MLNVHDVELPLAHTTNTNNDKTINKILLIIFLSIPALEFGCGLIYKNHSCNSFMTLSSWLYVSSIINIIFIVWIFVCVHYYHNKSILIQLVGYAFNICNTLWFLVGLVLFRRNCHNKLPDALNNFMWCVLTFKFVVCICLCLKEMLYKRCLNIFIEIR